MLQRLKARRAKVQLENMLSGAEPPVFPALTLSILDVIRNNESSIDDVAEALQWDPALTVKLLATVNSAAYAPRQPIQDVRHAANYLGRAQLEALVVAVACRAALPGKATSAFDPRRFWLTAAQRAGLARAISERLHPARSGEAFTAGLLLDLAIPVLSKRLGGDYDGVLAAWHAGEVQDLAALETEQCGVNHTAVGHCLAELWGLPEPVAVNIAAHHRPGTSDAEVMPAIRLVAPAREVPAEDETELLIETAREEYGLEADWTLGQVEISRDAAEDLAERMSS